MQEGLNGEGNCREFTCTRHPKTAEDDDDEDEKDSEMTLNGYKPWAKLSCPFGRAQRAV
jgi:hypothetical protein